MKYAIVGTGARHEMFRRAITETYAATNRLVGLCDSNPLRLALSARQVLERTGDRIATYEAPDFERMLAEQGPDTVIVTVPDHLHHRYIVAALKAGCDVITEKPMTIDLGKLKAILDAQAETGKAVAVAFNYRYTLARTQLRDILRSGAIGEIAAVDFRWHLDRVHGADYFRRWHRDKDKSGGLLVHKATHHFDLLNWWLASTPKTVHANGRLAFYTPQTAARLGLATHGARCRACPVAERCDFRLDIESDDGLRQVYLDAEDADGYWRDRCVFADDITIEDTMQVQVAYASRAALNYTLCAYSPWEGVEVTFHGTGGELSHRHVEIHGVFGGRRDFTDRDSLSTVLHVAGRKPEPIEVWQGAGDHGGADPVMLGYLFGDGGPDADPYERGSSESDGAWSILTGIAANRSMATGAAIDVDAMLAEERIALPRSRKHRPGPASQKPQAAPGAAPGFAGD
jgi:predicted dehydrogenase